MENKTRETGPGKKLHDLFREVFKLQSALSVVMDGVHEQAGLSTAQHRIMQTLLGMGSATVPDMASRLDVSRQFVQTVCNRLAAKALLEFTDNPRHKRSKLASLTDKGYAAYRTARRREDEIIGHALADVDTATAAQATKLLKDIRRAVVEDL